MDDHAIEKILAELAEEADGQRVTLGAILDRLQRRGFGPFITVLSLLVILPTGAIPGMPALVGLAIILFAGQILAGKTRPWFPRRIREIALPAATLRKGLEHGRPWVRRLSRLVHRRLEPLADDPVASRIVAAVAVVTALLLIVFGFIPFLPMVLGLNLAAFGLGLTARDGLLVIAGYGLFAGGLWLVLRATGVV